MSGVKLRRESWWGFVVRSILEICEDILLTSSFSCAWKPLLKELREANVEEDEKDLLS